MIKSIPYSPKHARMIALNVAYIGQDDVLEAYDSSAGFIMETIVNDNGKTHEIIAVMSACEPIKGMLEVSGLIGESAKKYPISFFRHARGRLLHFEETLKIRRTQSTIRAGFPFLIKWIELLGFEREGLMRKFGPEGDDYYLYARIK